MRRRVLGPLLLVLAVGAGCGLLPERNPESGFTPQAETCHLKPGADDSGDAYRPVGCSARHEAETFHVGRFGEADATSAERPRTGSAAALQAYASCDAVAQEFLGDDWRTARLSLRVVLPTAKGWRAAERWFRCDLVEIVALDQTEPVPRANSLRAALQEESPLDHGCYDPTFTPDGTVRTMPPASCTGPHHSQFTGVWWPDATGTEFTSDDMTDGCYRVASTYLRVSDDQELRRRIEVLYRPPAPEENDAGDSGVLCFLHTDGAPFTRSLAGTGRRGLPPPRKG